MTSITIARALADAERVIDAIEARVLLCHAMGRDKAYVIGHADAALGEAEQGAFEALVSRRAGGEPVAYLTEEREFFSLSFRVTPAVLIPRPETELLVELALTHIPRDTPRRVLDLGTGSGCVAISIAKHRPRASVTATDNSPDALHVAAINARVLGAANVMFTGGSWLDAVADQRFDAIVSTPPYVAEGDPHLRTGDLRFEPRLALTAGEDGLEAIRKIVSGASGHLTPGGWLIFEHGIEQAQRSRMLLEAAGFQEVFSRRDLAGIERVSGGRRGRT